MAGAVAWAVAGSVCDTLADAAGGWSALPYRLGFAVGCFGFAGFAFGAMGTLRGR